MSPGNLLFSNLTCLSKDVPKKVFFNVVYTDAEDGAEDRDGVKDGAEHRDGVKDGDGGDCRSG